MIVIRIELWPKGDKGMARLLGEGHIANVGGDLDYGNYRVSLLRSPEYAKASNVGKPWRRGEVSHFPRRRLGPWDLLLRALVATVGARNPRETRDFRTMIDAEDPPDQERLNF